MRKRSYSWHHSPKACSVFREKKHTLDWINYDHSTISILLLAMLILDCNGKKSDIFILWSWGL